MLIDHQGLGQQGQSVVVIQALFLWKGMYCNAACLAASESLHAAEHHASNRRWTPDCRPVGFDHVTQPSDGRTQHLQCKPPDCRAYAGLTPWMGCTLTCMVMLARHLSKVASMEQLHSMPLSFSQVATSPTCTHQGKATRGTSDQGGGGKSTQDDPGSAQACPVHPARQAQHETRATTRCSTRGPPHACADMRSRPMPPATQLAPSAHPSAFHDGSVDQTGRLSDLQRGGRDCGESKRFVVKAA